MIPVLEPVLKGNELKYVTECVETGWISSKGEFVRKFEEKLCEITGNPFVVSVSNGTVALSLALSVFGIGPGDEVIVPDFTFAATINSVLHVGSTPVIADVDPSSWNISVEAIRKSITPATKAIMPVHLYGIPAAMDEILSISQKHNLIVIEDCAEALGATYKGIHVGNFGDAGTFSFFGNKLITTGEGGAITFKDKKSYEKARILRDHGMSPSKRYWHDVVGFNFRMTNLQAAIGLAQLERYDQIVSSKTKVYDFYNDQLKGMERFIKERFVDTDATEGYWLYTIQLRPEYQQHRDSLISHLLKLNIETRPGFFPLHVMPPYVEYVQESKFPCSAALSQSTLSLPSSGLLTTAQQEIIVRELKGFLEQL